MHRLAGPALALILCAACGGTTDVPGDVDAPVAPDGDGGLDGATDAPVDAAIDAPPPPPFSGTFSVVEADLRVAGAPTPLGQGLQIAVAFTDNAMLPPPVLEEQAGPLGCKAWEYTPAEAAHATVGVDEGTFFFTVSGGSSPATPPVLPRCSHVAGAGYRCEDFATTSSGGVITDGPMAGTAVLTDNDVGYTAANSLGRWLRVEGAAQSANDGVFPIVGVGGANSVIYANPRRVAEVLPGAAQHVNVAGAGPIPGVSDPGFLADDAALAANHVAGGGQHVPAFNLTTEAPGHAGDDFTLDNVSNALIVRVPADGSELSFRCETGCGAGTADATIVEIITTDAPVALLPPAAMPPPMTRQVRLRCAQLGTDTIVIPAAYSAKLVTSGATRLQTTFVRGALLSWPQPPVTGVFGHALVGITTR